MPHMVMVKPGDAAAAMPGLRRLLSRQGHFQRWKNAPPGARRAMRRRTPERWRFSVEPRRSVRGTRSQPGSTSFRPCEASSPVDSDGYGTSRVGVSGSDTLDRVLLNFGGVTDDFDISRFDFRRNRLREQVD